MKDCNTGVVNHHEAKEKAMKRLYGLLDLQKEIERRFGDTGYNVFVFGSYLTIKYREGQRDIDIAIYSEDFELYKKISWYLEEYFWQKGIESDIFYIDISTEASIYCVPLNSTVQFTSYYPKRLVDFERSCQQKLKEAKRKVIK